MSALLTVKDLKKYFKTPSGWLHAVDIQGTVPGRYSS